MPIRILIADDHSMFRAGLRALLNAEPDLEVVGEAGDGEEALRRAEELHPDIVLLDIEMPELDGIEVARQLAQMLPDTRILILTLYDDADLLRAAIGAGAAGYIIKTAKHPELIKAIRAIAEGDSYIHPGLTSLMQALSAPGGSVEEILTPREIEVLRLVAQGYTNRQIAEELGISVRTAERHCANLMKKLNRRKRAELACYAAEQGLLNGQNHPLQNG